MAQRVFDKDNKKDMADLWDILPESIERIVKDETPEGNSYNRYYAKDYCYGGCAFIKINWHDDTVITRPVNYENMIGCVGWFWDDEERERALGIFTDYNPEMECCFIYNGNVACSHFRPATKAELKFWEDK